MLPIELIGTLSLTHRTMHVNLKTARMRNESLKTDGIKIIDGVGCCGAGERYTMKERKRARQSGVEDEGRRGVSVEGNISTLACMKDRSGRPEITR